MKIFHMLILKQGLICYRFGDESWSIGVRSQAILESYGASVNQAMEILGSRSEGRYFGTYGKW